jgi:hypothetical protein
VGFDFEDSTGKYDFSLFKWTVSDPSVVSLTKMANSPLCCKVKGLKSGQVKLTGKINDGGTEYSCEFTITVYPEGTVQTESEVYFTTTQNVVVLGSTGASTVVSVNPVRMRESEYSKITWTVEKSNIASVLPNGNKATVTAMGEGETVINVSHPDSQNTLKIYVRVGSEYISPETKPVVYISAQDVLTMLRDDEPQKLQAVLVNCTESDTSGFSFSIDNESIAKISGQSTNGTAYVKPVGSGQAEITITHKKTDINKKVLVVVGNSAEELAGFAYLTTPNNVVSIGEGNNKTVSVQIKNKDDIVIDGYSWSSNNTSVVEVVENNGSAAVLKGNKIGTSVVTVKNSVCKYPLDIIVQVIDPIAAAANPYIQLSSSVMTLTVGNIYTSVTADLVGGTDGDKSDFSWKTENSSVAVIYGQNEVGKIRAMQPGMTYITVSHPKAVYDQQLLVVCDAPKENNCYISVPSSILSMKPTDSSQTITASLVNGDANDKYAFSWSLDVYDIIDFDYSANICTITPKQSGKATITISHPKAAYDQQVIVNVQQYSTFAFPNDNMTVTQGDVTFVPMQIPTTSIRTHVEYTSGNSSICEISGINTTAQIKAVGNGTTTVKARLIATSSGKEQATTEMMVCVKEKQVDAVYITAASTITTLKKGSSQTLSASLVGSGIEPSDLQNLIWTTADTGTIKITGIGADGSAKGQSVYITALEAGNAVITCSHGKAAGSLQFLIVVPEEAKKKITLSAENLPLKRGGTVGKLKADIENLDNHSDYNSIEWSCTTTSGKGEICRVMGSGRNVSIQPLAIGSARVVASIPGGDGAECMVYVTAPNSFKFDKQQLNIEPEQNGSMGFTVTPPDAMLTWAVAQDQEYFTFNKDVNVVWDNQAEGRGHINITTTLTQGTGAITCVSEGAVRDYINVKNRWNYVFKSDYTGGTVRPDGMVEIPYYVYPSCSKIEDVSDDKDEFFSSTVNQPDSKGYGTIVINPKKEVKKAVRIKIIAKNPKADDEEFGKLLFSLNFHYPKVTLSYSFENIEGRYSKEEGGFLYIGDGETCKLSVGIAEKNPSGKIISVKFSKAPEVSTRVRGQSESSSITLKDWDGDYKVGYYKITKLYEPYFKVEDNVERADWENFSLWCWLQYDRPVSTGTFDTGTGHDEYFSLIYIPFCVDSANHGLNHLKSEEQVKSHAENVCFWAEENDLHLPFAYNTSSVSPYFNSFNWEKKLSDRVSEGSPKWMRQDEFEENPWLFCPGTSTLGDDMFVRWNSEAGAPMLNGFGTIGVTSPYGGVSVAPRVMSEHVTAEFCYSPYKDYIENKTIGTITVTYEHLGVQKNEEIPVIWQKRECEM